MADDEFPGGGSYGPGAPAQPMMSEAQRGAAVSESPLESLTVFVTEALPHALGEIIEAVHDHFQSPEDRAMENMEHVTALHQQMIEHLAAGDVDGAVALNAQAEAELNSAVLHLSNPDYKEPHHSESHDDASSAPFFPQQMEIAPQLPAEYGHGDDHIGHG